MPLVVAPDSEKALTDYLFALLPTIPEAASWSVGTRVAPGETPRNAVRVRMVGGVDEGRTHTRPLVDVRLWADGSAKTESAVKKVARIVHGHMLADFRARTLALPVPLPDPADNSKVHVLFTIELLTKGAQS